MRNLLGKFLRLPRGIPAHERRLTVSTFLTLVRVILTPLIIAAMIYQAWNIAFWLFGAAALTDIVDGHVARLLHEQTLLGACLDPIADKILLVACFTTLAFVQSPLFAIPRWFVMLVLIKEVVQVGGALIIYCYKGALEVRPTLLGKLTTVFQVCFILWLFACYFFTWLPVKTYYVMLGGLMTLIILVFAQYVLEGLRQLRL